MDFIKTKDKISRIKNTRRRAYAEISLLAQCIVDRDSEKVALLLDHVQDINLKMADGDTVLIKTAKEAPEMLEHLLRNPKLVVNIPGAENKTALNYAAGSLSSQAASLLIDAGAVCRSSEIYTVSPLVDALGSSFISMGTLKVLLSSGASVLYLTKGRTCFCQALKRGDVDLAMLFAEHNPAEKMRAAQSAYREIRETSGGDGAKGEAGTIALMHKFNPLYTESFFGGDSQFVREELTRLREFVLKNTKPLSAEEVFFSLNLRSEDVVDYLLECGVEPNSPFLILKRRYLILNVCVERALSQPENAFCRSVARKLLRSGADPSLRDEKGRSALDLALPDTELSSMLKTDAKTPPKVEDLPAKVKVQKAQRASLNGRASNLGPKREQIKLKLKKDNTCELRPLKEAVFGKRSSAATKPGAPQTFSKVRIKAALAPSASPGRGRSFAEVLSPAKDPPSAVAAAKGAPPPPVQAAKKPANPKNGPEERRPALGEKEAQKPGAGHTAATRVDLVGEMLEVNADRAKKAAAVRNGPEEITREGGEGEERRAAPESKWEILTVESDYLRLVIPQSCLGGPPGGSSKILYFKKRVFNVR